MTFTEKLNEVKNVPDNDCEVFHDGENTVLQFFPDWGVMEEWIFNADTEEAIEGFLYTANMPQPTPPIPIYP